MKFLIVGLGSMGKRRIRNLKALGLEEIAGYDPRADRRKEAAERYGIDTLNVWSLACNWPADAWIISTPPLTHMALAVEALALKRHVFTEADLPDSRVRQIIAERDRSGLIAVPSCTMIHHPGPTQIRALIADGSIGTPQLFTYHTGQHLADWHPWESYGEFYAGQRETGAAREIVPYELIWLTRQFGSINQLVALHGRSGTLDCDIDDHYALAVQFTSGIVGTLLIDALSRPAVRNLRISGDNGVLEWNNDLSQVRCRPKGMSDWRIFELVPGTVEAGYINSEEPYIAEIAAFVAAIRGQRPYPFSYEDEEEVLDVLMQAEKGHMKVRTP